MKYDSFILTVMVTTTVQEINFGANFKQLCLERAVARTHNNGFKKLAVQWLIEHLCFVSISVLADSLVLRSRSLGTPIS